MSIDVLNRHYEDLLEEIQDLRSALKDARTEHETTCQQLSIMCKFVDQVSKENEALKTALKYVTPREII